MPRWVAIVDEDGRRALETGARRALELFASAQPEDTEARGLLAIREWLRDPTQENLTRMGDSCARLHAHSGIRRQLVDLGRETRAPLLVEWAHATLLGVGLTTAGSRGIASLLFGMPHTAESATPVFRWSLGPGCSTSVVELGTNEVGDWLRTRMNRGELDRWRIELAAWAGDPRARRALRQPAPSDADPRAWIEGLRQFPGQGRLVARAAIWAIPWQVIERAIAESRHSTSSQESLNAAIRRARQACLLPHRSAPFLGECAVPFEQLGAHPATDAILARSLRAIALAIRCWAAPEGAVDALLALLPVCAEDVADSARNTIAHTPLEETG